MIKLLTPKDSDWHTSPDGFTLVPRAAIRINDSCPIDYHHLIYESISKGWIEPIAYMIESEYMWEKLKD